MSKEEFLQTLREALAGEVPEGLIQENVQYYDQYITAEMRKGRTAQNIIEELGGPRIIAKTIIDASELPDRPLREEVRKAMCMEEVLLSIQKAEERLIVTTHFMYII